MTESDEMAVMMICSVMVAILFIAAVVYIHKGPRF
jgi:hypothetical protein